MSKQIRAAAHPVSSFAQAYLLSFDIVATSSIHITSVEPGRYNPAYRSIRRTGNEEPGTFPCALTRTKQILRPSKTTDVAAAAAAPDSADGKGEKAVNYVFVPTLPASTVRGKLRNATSGLVEDACVAQGQKLSLAAYLTMRSGSASTDLASNEKTVMMSHQARNDPFFGLMGGTTFAYAANTVIHDAIPISEDTAWMLKAPTTCPLIPSGVAMTGATQIIRKDPLLDIKDPEHIDALLDHDAVVEYQAMRLEDSLNKASRKAANDGGKKTDIRTVAAVEGILPGVHMQLCVEVDARTPEQLGLLILSLQKVFADGQVGGKGANGFGTYALVNSTIRSADGKVCEPLFGKRVGVGFGMHPIDSAAVQPAVEAARNWLGMLDVASIEGFAKPAKEKVAKAAKVAP